MLWEPRAGVLKRRDSDKWEEEESMFQGPESESQWWGEWAETEQLDLSSLTGLFHHSPSPLLAFFA